MLKRTVTVYFLMLMLLSVVSSSAFGTELIVQPMAFQYLYVMKTDVDYFNGRLYFTSDTKSTEPVQNIKTTVKVQKWDGYKWVDINSFYDSRTNASFSQVSGSIEISNGYYYRAIGYHYVDHYGYREQSTTYSSNIFAK